MKTLLTLTTLLCAISVANAQFTFRTRSSITMSLNSGSVNPSSGTVYFSGITPGLTPAAAKVPLRGFKAAKTGTINLAEVQLMVSGTAGSTESIAFHIINDTTSTTNLIGSVESSDTSRRVSKAATALSVTAGDQLYIQTTSPTWATPPTGVYIQGLVVIE